MNLPYLPTFQDIISRINLRGYQEEIWKKYGDYPLYNFGIILILWDYPCLFVFKVFLFFAFIFVSLYSTRIFGSLFFFLSLDPFLWLKRATSRFGSKTFSIIFPVISNRFHKGHYFSNIFGRNQNFNKIIHKKIKKYPYIIISIG